VFIFQTYTTLHQCTASLSTNLKPTERSLFRNCNCTGLVWISVIVFSIIEDNEVCTKPAVRRLFKPMNYLFAYSKAAVAHSSEIRRAQRATFTPFPNTSNLYRGAVTLTLANNVRHHLYITSWKIRQLAWSISYGTLGVKEPRAFLTVNKPKSPVPS
jgi:hypothetical protein